MCWIALSTLLLAAASSYSTRDTQATINQVKAQSTETHPRPSLLESEHWIENTFTDENVGYYQIFSSDNAVEKSYSIVFEGCRVGLESSEIDRYKYKGTQTEKQSSVIDYVDLKDIDPASIKVDGHIVIVIRRAIVGFRTTNDERKITEFRSPNGIEELVRPSLSEKQPHYSPHRTSKTNNLEMGIVMAPEYATRFVKAMRHAVQLCGGKGSAF